MDYQHPQYHNPVQETTHSKFTCRQLRFDGTGGQLFGKYLLWMLLTVATLGIYVFCLEIKMKQWIVKHTRFA